ncbi:MAG: hypothetical protein ACRCT8_15115 [Lacipirellulaceae bacterium]
MVSALRLFLAAAASLVAIACSVTPNVAMGVIVARYDFATDPAVSTDTDLSSTAGPWVPANLGTTPNPTPPNTPFVNSGISASGQAFVRGTGTGIPLATTTASNINPASTVSFHSFKLTVDGILPGQTLSLTKISFDRRADSGQRGWTELYSDATGFTTANRLGQHFTFSTSTVSTFHNLPVSGPLANLAPGSEVEFRFYFSTTATTNVNNVQRIDNVVLEGNVVGTPSAVPEPSAFAFFSLMGFSSCLLRRPGRS